MTRLACTRPRMLPERSLTTSILPGTASGVPMCHRPIHHLPVGPSYSISTGPGRARHHIKTATRSVSYHIFAVPKRLVSVATVLRIVGSCRACYIGFLTIRPSLSWGAAMESWIGGDAYGTAESSRRQEGKPAGYIRRASRFAGRSGAADRVFLYPAHLHARPGDRTPDRIAPGGWLSG